MKTTLLFLPLLFLCSLRLAAQAPEQDCIHAIQIDSPVYVVPLPYAGAGAIPQELGPPNEGCLFSGEKNDAWFRIIVYGSGRLAMKIAAANALEDFDFALWNVTGHNGCEALYNYSTHQQQTFPPVTCNYSPTTGDQGLDDSITGMGWNPAIDVLAGDTLLLNVSSFSMTAGGYVLSFGRSTAAIVAPPPPPPPTGFSGTTAAVFSISPNPAGEWIRVRLKQPGPARIAVRSLSGQLVLQRELTGADREHQIDVGQLPQGSYIVELLQAGQRQYQRIQLLK